MRYSVFSRMKLLAASGFCLTVAGSALAQPLPFQDGRYLNQPDLCSLSEDQLFAEAGDEIYEMLVEIRGPSLNEGYGAFCEIGDVSRSGDAVEFVASCDVEGDTYDIRFSYMFISPTSFRIQDKVYQRCG